MSKINIEMLFQNLIHGYSHLLTVKPQTKEEFLNNIKNTYSKGSPRNIGLFYQSVEKSTFETIRLNDTRDTVLINVNN